MLPASNFCNTTLPLHVQAARDVAHLLTAHDVYLAEAVQLCAAPPVDDGGAAAVTGGRLEAVLRVCQDLALLR